MGALYFPEIGNKEIITKIIRKQRSANLQQKKSHVLITVKQFSAYMHIHAFDIHYNNP